MKKLILIILAFAFIGLVFQGTSEAKVFQFKDLIDGSNHIERFDPAGDHVVFRHGPDEAFPLVYKQREDGIEFKLDNGEGNSPRYNMLGKLPIQICPEQELKMNRQTNVRGTLVNFLCGQ